MSEEQCHRRRPAPTAMIRRITSAVMVSLVVLGWVTLRIGVEIPAPVLETAAGPPATRYPRLAARRAPTATELDRVQALYEACPQLEAPGKRDTVGEAGWPLAEVCRVCGFRR